MLEGHGAVRTYSKVVEEAVSGTEKLAVVAAVMEPTGMHWFLNNIDLISWIYHN